MPQAQVRMDVRKASENACVIDVEGEFTAFAEGVMMEAYNQSCAEGARVIILNFEGLEYMNPVVCRSYCAQRNHGRLVY